MRHLVALVTLVGLSVAEVTNRLGQVGSDRLPKFLTDCVSKTDSLMVVTHR